MNPFADDVTIYSSRYINPERACTDVQTSLNLVSRWSHESRLAVENFSREIECPDTQYFEHDFFLIGGQPLTFVDSVRSLGVTIDSSLNFNCHITELVAKAKRTSALICRCFNSRHVSSLENAFKIYVRPMI